MKKVKLGHAEEAMLKPVKLKDFSLFEEKMTKIKHLKELKQNMDKGFFSAAIDELGLKGKRITAKKVKRIFKKALINMMEEDKR